MQKSYLWFILGAVLYTFFIFMAGFMTSSLNYHVNHDKKQKADPISETIKDNIVSFASGTAQAMVGDFAQKMLSRSSK